ncbi:Sec-independent protein translocase subunit TatA [Streptomyces tremellae]|uniref:Sec-independent protein translocase protein TatA n=1 Tax=Streptomyces tremellae TaxID=1124239 RepID=A0ABP7DSJ1_9ACTN
MLRNGLEPWHVLVVVLVVALLFGSKKLPDAARGLGKSLRIFKSEVRAMKTLDETGGKDAAPAPDATAAAPSGAVVSTARKEDAPASEAAGRGTATAH